MVAFGGYEDLSFVHQPPKCLTVDDPVAITLKRRTQITAYFRPFTPLTFTALTRIFRKIIAFNFFSYLARINSRTPPALPSAARSQKQEVSSQKKKCYEVVN